jgi:TctA family transporter
METIVSLVVGTILPFIINEGKKFGVTAKHSIIIIAFACGAFYGFYEYFMPIELKSNVYALFTQILTTSFLIYEFLLKKSSPKKKK